MLALIIIALSILVVFLLHYQQPKAEIPHEVCGRVLLHIFHHIMSVLFSLVSMPCLKLLSDFIL